MAGNNILVRSYMDKETLIKFEEEIKELFLERQISSPVHLSRGNEDQLIDIFKQVKREDWVFSTHRSHYHALLHGISPEWLRDEILQGRSMQIFSREPKFFSSSIVGGCLPIAVGVAMAIKQKGEPRHVWVFVGDMAAETGAFHECTKYAARNSLPVTFVVEDNELSTEVPTQEVWGLEEGEPRVIRYRYERGFPHAGVGTWVTF